MPVRRTIHESQGVYFVTFTCARWIKLFELTNSYDLVYNWFKYLIVQGHHIIGYTIKSINTIVGNGKRFIAYDIVERLKREHLNDTLELLSGWVNSTDRSRNKKHEVFEPSFDWKECNDEHLIEQKLNYIHENASKGDNRLFDNPADHRHSSAPFYILDEEVAIPVTTYLELQDIDLTVLAPQSP